MGSVSEPGTKASYNRAKSGSAKAVDAKPMLEAGGQRAQRQIQRKTNLFQKLLSKVTTVS